MKVEQKDKDNHIQRALSLLGYRVSRVQVEVILNVVEFIKDKEGDTTIKDIVTIESLVESLFQDQTKNNEQ